MDFIIQWLKSIFGTSANLSAFISALAVLVAAISSCSNIYNSSDYRKSQKPKAL